MHASQPFEPFPRRKTATIICKQSSHGTKTTWNRGTETRATKKTRNKSVKLCKLRLQPVISMSPSSFTPALSTASFLA